MLDLTFNSVKYSQARFFWSSIVFLLNGVKTIHRIHQVSTVWLLGGEGRRHDVPLIAATFKYRMQS